MSYSHNRKVNEHEAYKYAWKQVNTLTNVQLAEEVKVIASAYRIGNFDTRRTLTYIGKPYIRAMLDEVALRLEHS